MKCGQLAKVGDHCDDCKITISILEAELATQKKQRDQLLTIVETMVILARVVLEDIQRNKEA